MNWTILLSSFFLIGFGSCKKQQRVSYKSFYYWKSSLHAADIDTLQMATFGLKRLYIKYLDIDWNGMQGAQPRSITQIEATALPLQLEIVPTIFIMNRVFLNLKSTDLPLFADRLLTQIQSIPLPFTELQIDCDWSEGSRARYFEFLKILKQKATSISTLSATIRLHQIRYRHKTGIPPVDRGMLMMYNFLKVSDFNDRNSIYETAEARKYLRSQKPYPLPLDVVLPVWSWAVAYREGTYLHLFNQLNTQKAATLTFLEREKGPFFKVKQDTVFEKVYLRLGDRLKIEEVLMPHLREAAQLSNTFIQNDTLHVSFFHWDKTILQNNSFENLQKAIDLLE